MSGEIATENTSAVDDGANRIADKGAGDANTVDNDAVKDAKHTDTDVNDAKSDGSDTETEDANGDAADKSRIGFTDWISLVTSGYSLFSYLLDVGTDIDLVIHYKNRGLLAYFWATLACIVIPHLLLVITDIEMLWEDRKNWLQYQKQLAEQQNEDSKEQQKEENSDHEEENLLTGEESDAGNADNQSTDDTVSSEKQSNKSRRCCKFDFVQCTFTHDTGIYILRIFIGLLGLGVIIRKLQRLHFKFRAIKAPNDAWRGWYEAKMLEAQRDSSNLAFICAFTENCPQSLLQLYIYVQNPVPLYESIGRSIITSLLNLPLSYANYYRSTRRQPKKEGPPGIRDDLHHVAFIFYYLGLLGAVIVRMLSIGLFIGTVSVKYGFIVLGVHFIGNIIFIHFYQKPGFAGLSIAENKCSKFFSVTVNTLLYSLVNLVLFVDLNDRTGKRWRILTNNIILYTENFAFVILSFVVVGNVYAMYYGMVVGLGCVLHVIMLPNYYIFLHPTTGACFNCGEQTKGDNSAIEQLHPQDIEMGSTEVVSDTQL